MGYNKILYLIGPLILLAFDLGNGNDTDMGGISNHRDPKICNQILYYHQNNRQHYVGSSTVVFFNSKSFYRGKIPKLRLCWQQWI